MELTRSSTGNFKWSLKVEVNCVLTGESTTFQYTSNFGREPGHINCKVNLPGGTTSPHKV